MPTEVDTHPMIKKTLAMGKRVLLPQANLENKELEIYEIRERKDLQKGLFGIWEPDPDRARLADPREADLVLVPGLLFDKKNNRLGRGLGFYDRFLKRLSRKVIKIGLAFSFQVVESIPAEAHDIPVDLVLTD